MSIQNLTGQTLGQYELRELLGAGGMGAVYRSYQSTLKRYVAVKILSATFANQPGAIERFNREAETSASLEHPNIIHIYDYGTQRGVNYLVMQLLTGGTLAERLTQRATSGQALPSLGEIASLLKQVGSALDYAHSRGVIHRDIKPSNVMFDNHGNAYLVDFGIAKLKQASTGLTASGMVVGTWGYMPPEQWRGGVQELTPAADQYALGVMTYALLVGRLPFEAPDAPSIMHKHFYEMPTPPHTQRPGVPEAITQVIERALAKKPEDRFPTCTALAQAFDKALRGQTGEMTNFFTSPFQRQPSAIFVPTPSRPATAPSHPARKSPLVWALTLLILGLIGALAVVALLFQNRQGSINQRETHVAETQAAFIAPGSLAPDQVQATQVAATVNVMNATAVERLETRVKLTEVAFRDQTAAAAQWTATPSPTWTATPLPATAIQATQVAATVNAMNATAVERLETRVKLTEVAFRDQTAAAAQWTLTPSPSHTFTPSITPNMTETMDVAFQVFQTATAAQWTSTPSPMPTSIPQTPLASPSPALLPAGSSNRAWTPVVQDLDGATMVYVPAGCFRMGSSFGYSDEQPVHEVCLDAFWIDQTEVTNGQYGSVGAFSGEQRPRESVSWTEAQAFCEDRASRLPTEAEWEYAARGPEGWAYPWGSAWDGSQVIWSASSGSGPVNVGSKPGGASWVGALDLSGNVGEWVADWYGTSYPAGTQTNPTGPTSGGSRVVRGGSWGGLNADGFRTTYRSSGVPDRKTDYTGFRCVRDAEGTAPQITQSPATAAQGAAPTPIPAGSSNRAWTPVEQDLDGVAMVYVPAGCFNMGSNDGDEDEQPVHEVCPDAFWIDQTEVTNGQYGSSGYWSGNRRPRES